LLVDSLGVVGVSFVVVGLVLARITVSDFLLGRHEVGSDGGPDVPILADVADGASGFLDQVEEGGVNGFVGNVALAGLAFS
jgi:hypothetical protein